MYIVLDDVVENLFNDVINAYKIKSIGGGGVFGSEFSLKKIGFFDHYFIILVVKFEFFSHG